MGKIIEKIIYGLGVNVTRDDSTKDLILLGKHVPKDYKQRDMTDLGCGDGKTIKD